MNYEIIKKKLLKKNNLIINIYNNSYKELKFSFEKKFLEIDSIKFYNTITEKYKLIIPKFTLFDWCSIFETLIYSKIKFYNYNSNYLHICSNEESSYMSLNSYFNKIKKKNIEKINNLIPNINNKLNTIYKLKKYKKNNKNINIIIYNCYLDFDLEKTTKYKLNFTYFLNNKKYNIYTIQFNYVNNKTNIITIYYKYGSFFFGTKGEHIKNLGYELTNKINRTNKNHKYKLHKKNNPLEWHFHVKINIKDEKPFLNKLFNLFNILDKKIHIDNIFHSKKIFLNNNNNKKKIRFNNKSYSQFIFNNSNNNSNNNNLNINSKNINKYKNNYFKKIRKKNINVNEKNYKFLIGSLILLNKKGTLIFKYSLPLFSIFDTKLICFLKKLFKSINIYQPEYMKYTNHFYIVCKNYKNDLDISILEKIYRKIKKFKKFNVDKYINKNDIFLIEDLIKNFINKINNILDLKINFLKKGIYNKKKLHQSFFKNFDFWYNNLIV